MAPRLPKSVNKFVCVAYDWMVVWMRMNKWLHVCMYACMCVWACVWTNMCVWLYEYMCVYERMYACVWSNEVMYVYTYTNEYMCISEYEYDLMNVYKQETCDVCQQVI